MKQLSIVTMPENNCVVVGAAQPMKPSNTAYQPQGIVHHYEKK